jgi:integrase
VRRVFVRLLKRAKLPLHFSPHSLRHTFASLLLQQGESPVYVQRQLGHASIKHTVDTHGKWLPMGNKAAVDRLDDGSGSKADPGCGGCCGSARKIW